VVDDPLRGSVLVVSPDQIREYVPFPNTHPRLLLCTLHLHPYPDSTKFRDPKLLQHRYEMQVTASLILTVCRVRSFPFFSPNANASAPCCNTASLLLVLRILFLYLGFCCKAPSGLDHRQLFRPVFGTPRREGTARGWFWSILDTIELFDGKKIKRCDAMRWMWISL
jgi:hypothetical protein